MTDMMKVKQLRAALGATLDSVDYTSGACRLTEMVGAVLPKEVIAVARQAMKDSLDVETIVDGPLNG